MTKKIRVLYVDDYPFDRELVLHALKEGGDIQVVTAASRSEFETQLSEGGFDIVLTDFNILGFDGLAVMAAVKGRFPHVPVVIVTGTGSEEVAVEAMKGGASDYVIKTPKRIRRLPETIRSVLEKQRINDALSKSQSRYEALVKYSSDQIFLLDPAGVYLESSIPERGSGRESDKSMIGLRLRDVHAQSVAEVFETAMKAVMGTGESTRFEYELCEGDEARHTLCTLYPILKNGRVEAVGGICHDITEMVVFRQNLEQTQSVLQENITFLEVLIDTIPSPIFYKDRDGVYIGCNKAFEAFVGKSKKEILGRTVHDLAPPEIADRYHEKDEELFHSPGRQMYQWKVKSGDETERDVVFYKATFTDAHQEVAGLVGVILDITEREQMRMQKEKVQNDFFRIQKMEAIGTLAGGIAHDFNNILGIISGNCELAMDDVPQWNPAAENLEEIRKASGRARELIKQILRFARQDEEVVKPTPLAPIIKEALKFLKSTIPSVITLQQDISADVGNVLADPTQIYQVIMNLCTNAVQAMTEMGSVLGVELKNITVGPTDPLTEARLDPGDFVYLSVTDTGTGMEKAVLDRIFEPYFTTKEPGEGTGMGLAVTHGIVQRYGGTILVESGPGRGTTFHVYFPRYRGDAVSEPVTEMVLPTGKERILLVDDDETMLETCRRILSRLGYAVVAKSNPVDALEAFSGSSGAYDLVITDMAMPAMYGDVLAKQLHEIRPDMPILLCTGFHEEAKRHRKQDTGIVGVLLKPVVKKELAVRIREVLDGGKP